jgi:hypothetical protein
MVDDIHAEFKRLKEPGSIKVSILFILQTQMGDLGIASTATLALGSSPTSETFKNFVLIPLAKGKLIIV